MRQAAGHRLQSKLNRKLPEESDVVRGAGKRQPAINLSDCFHIPATVLVNLRKPAGSEIGIDFRSVETLLRRRDSQSPGEEVETYMLPSPFAPLVHGVENRRILETSEGNLPRRLDLVNYRSLINKSEIKIQKIVTDE